MGVIYNVWCQVGECLDLGDTDLVNPLINYFINVFYKLPIRGEIF
jgi:hypothetical protein